MASRNFPNGFNSNLHRPVFICVKWAVGAVGAVGAVVGDYLNPAAVPVVRNGAGDYTITLADNYTNIYHVSIMIDSAAANEDLYGQVAAYNAAAAGGATVQILCKTGAVNTDPGAGDEVQVMIVASNSGLNA